MSKEMDNIHKGLVRKFHTLCGKLGYTSDDKEFFVRGLGVYSSADIDTHTLIDVCNDLSKKLEAENGGDEMDKLRKRAMAAIGGWLRATNQCSSAEIIKGIACRATEYDNFNKIPAERLRNIYSTFCNKQKDKQSIETIVSEMLLQNVINNPQGQLLN